MVSTSSIFAECAFILSLAIKGKRFSLPNSRIMIHQPLGGAQGGQTDIDIQVIYVLDLFSLYIFKFYMTDIANSLSCVKLKLHV